MRSSSVEEVGTHGPGDPWEVFTALAILVVEGRTPGGEKGYHAGPHCPLPQQLQHKHSCDQNDHMCVQAGALVRQLRVMWGVGVGVSLEVLVAPECKHGATLATTLDTTIAPSQNLRLIEQWNFTIYDRRVPEASATGWSLVAAVRSFLHFSQLSAWLSTSRGHRPPNVLYRLTVTSPVFCSKFCEDAEEHVFPLAYMGQDTSIKVAVRSSPRSEKVPVVLCHESHEKDGEEEEMPLESDSPSCSQTKAEMARCEEDLRRSVMKAKLAENTRVSRSESPDTQLGESLLDPPNSLNRFPRRYQSPSRSGSPSLETPEHLICRHRHPVPPNSRPPDIMPLIPSAARHPFSWTQARYPMTPMNIHPSSSSSSVYPSSSGLPFPPHYHCQQSPYRIDYSGSSQTPFHRPRLVYSRPQLSMSQAEPVEQVPQQKPHSSHQSLQPVYFDSLQNQHGRLSPRGGKYQNYPEYMCTDQTEPPRDFIKCNEYVGPSKRTKNFRFSGMKDFSSEAEFSSKVHVRGEIPNKESFKMQSQSSSIRKDTTSHWGEMDEPHTSRFEYRKNTHNESKSLHPQSPSEFKLHRGEFSTKDGETVGTRLKRCISSSKDKKHHESEEVPPEVIDDQLRPCCSHTGKHLCSSMEDLSDVCDKETESSCQLHPKDLKHRGDVSPSHLFHNKSNFDLTPKETMEILSVLNKSSNMRIDSPSSHSKVVFTRSQSETPSYHLGILNSSMKSDMQLKADMFLWNEEEIERHILKGKGKKIGSPYWKEDDFLEYGAFTMCDISGKSWEKTMPSFSSACAGSQMGPKTPSTSFPISSSSSSSTSYGCSSSSAHSSKERCQNQNLDRMDVHQSTCSSENDFLEAIALTGEKHCDISSCKTLVDSREPFRTRVSSGDSVCDNSNSEYSLKEGYRENDQKCYDEQQCIEAKKITQKTNFFTACSEPAKAVHCQPMKQVSHSLSKSPFSAILSSIQNEYNQEPQPDESSQQHQIGDHLKTSVNCKEVKRVLNFPEVSSEKYMHLNFSEEGPSKVSNYMKSPEQTERNGIHEAESTSRVRETREGFAKSSSLLRHLMKRHSSPPQGNSQDDTPMMYNGSDHVDSTQTVSHHSIDHYANQTENGDVQMSNGTQMHLDDLNGEDNEVEKYCNVRGVAIPSASEKAQFRRSLDSATNMVFHSKTGLPLTSSPAPLRKGKRFDYDSSLISIAAIKRSTSFHCSALYTCDTEEEEAYNLEMHAACRAHKAARKSLQLSASAPATVTCSNLLGSFEECVLNGRLEPVSTVQGFTAEIAASGAFCPKRTTKPVTVFFYTLCDNDQISSPYMGHINLGKKGYHVPNKGTVQVTLFNPHGTVVKMFVVMYDLSDMPPNSRTFVRQRTLNMPVGANDTDINAHQWLRYLIHLRFASSKSGKIYLHTDIRMLILRKSDADAATLHKTSVPYELRSFTHGPTNPKFSPRK